MSKQPNVPQPQDRADTDHAELHRMIARLGAPLSCSATRRRKLRVPPGELLFGIFDEIGATVMARRLEFRNADGAALSLEVRNRRLFRAEFEQPEVFFDAETVEGAPQASAFFRALRAFCVAGGVSVESAMPLREAEADESGVSTGKLRDLLRKSEAVVPEIPISSLLSLEDFAEQTCPLSLAWLFRDGAGELRKGGSSELCAGLDHALEGLASILTDLGAGQTIGLLLESADPITEQLGVFSDGSALLALVIPRADQATVLAAWSAWTQNVSDG